MSAWMGRCRPGGHGVKVERIQSLCIGGSVPKLFWVPRGSVFCLQVKHLLINEWIRLFHQYGVVPLTFKPKQSFQVRTLLISLFPLRMFCVSESQGSLLSSIWW